MIAWLERAQSRLATVCLILAGTALVVMVALITANVLGRWLIGHGVRGTEELSRCLMVGSVYLGLAGTLRDKSFIRVELVFDRLGRRVKFAALLLIYVLSLAFCLLLAWHTWDLVLSAYERGVESIGVLRLPLYLPQSFMAIGVTALCMQLAVMLLALRPEQVDEAGTSREDLLT